MPDAPDLQCGRIAVAKSGRARQFSQKLKELLKQALTLSEKRTELEPEPYFPSVPGPAAIRAGRERRRPVRLLPDSVAPALCVAPWTETKSRSRGSVRFQWLGALESVDQIEHFDGLCAPIGRHVPMVEILLSLARREVGDFAKQKLKVVAHRPTAIASGTSRYGIHPRT